MASFYGNDRQDAMSHFIPFADLTIENAADLKFKVDGKGRSMCCSLCFALWLVRGGCTGRPALIQQRSLRCNAALRFDSALGLLNRSLLFAATEGHPFAHVFEQNGDVIHATAKFDADHTVSKKAAAWYLLFLPPTLSYLSLLGRNRFVCG